MHFCSKRLFRISYILFSALVFDDTKLTHPFMTSKHNPLSLPINRLLSLTSVHQSRLKHFKSIKQESKMKLHHIKSKIGKKNMYDKHVVGFPISSEEYMISIKSSPKTVLPDPAAHQYQIMPSPSKHYPKIKHGRLDSVISKMIKLGESVDILAQGVREHVRLGPKLSEVVKGKLSLGARILQVGGVEKVFKQNFNIKDGEKLLNACQCYLSTTAGPIAGLLFVSSERVAFCSERSIKLSSPIGKLLKLRYKVMIPLGKIKRAVESENVKKPREKYVEIATEDNFDFWFMGFLNHQRMLKFLQQAIHRARREF